MWLRGIWFSYGWNFRKIFTMVTNKIAYESTLYKWHHRSALGVCILAQSMVSMPAFSRDTGVWRQLCCTFSLQLAYLKVTDEDCCSFLSTDSFFKSLGKKCKISIFFDRWSIVYKTFLSLFNSVRYLEASRFSRQVTAMCVLEYYCFRSSQPNPTSIT